MYLDRRLLSLASGITGRVALAALVGLLATAAGVARLALSGYAIALVFRGAPGGAVIMALAAVGGAVLLRAGLQYAREMMAHHTAAAIKVELRKKLYGHLLKLGPGYLDERRTGGLLITLVEGVETLETFFGQYLPQFVVAAIAPVIIFAFMAALDLQIALIFLAFALFTLLGPAAFHRLNRQSSLRRRQSYGALGSDFVDAVQGLSTLKSFGQSRSFGERLAARAQDLYQSTMRLLAVNIMTGGVTMLGVSAGAAVALAWGAIRVSRGELAIEPLLVVLMLGVEVFRPLRELTELYHRGMVALSASLSIFAVLDTPPAIVDPARIGRTSEPAKHLPVTSARDGAGQPCIAFDGVTFGYLGGRRPALRDLSFAVAAGERIGIVGPSGAGKSTVVALLLRFFDPQAGVVRIDGRDLRDIPLDELRQMIAVVAQDTYLFHGTVAENLRFGKPDATQDELEAAARSANAHDFIAALPQGYETIVGERGTRLSGGQRQRIAIARAILKGAPILLLDEATSSVDSESETAIQEALERLMIGRTTLIIAHRLSSVINADRILVLEEGQLAETGRHAELLARSGIYARLMAAQTTGVSEELEAIVGDEPARDDTPALAGGNNGAALQLPRTVMAAGNLAGTSANGDSNYRDGSTGAPVVIRATSTAAGTQHAYDMARAAATVSDPAVAVVTGQQTQASRPVGWRLLELVMPWRGQFALTVSLGVLQAIAVIMLGVVSALLVGRVATGGEITPFIIGLALLVPVAAVLTWAESWQSHDLAYRLLGEMRIALYDKLDPLAPGYLIRRRTGDLAGIMTADVESVELFFAHTIAPAIVAVVIPIGVLIWIGTIAWPLALALLPFLGAVGLSPFIAARSMDRLGVEMRRQTAELNAHMVDNLQGMREIAAFRRGGQRTGETVAKSWDLVRSQIAFRRQMALQNSAIEAFTGLGGLAVMATGAAMVSAGAASATAVPLVTLLALASFHPVSTIARVAKELADAVASARRVFAIHDEPVLIRDGAGVPAAAGTTAPIVEFDAVGFRYGPNEPWALRDVTFTVEAGKTVALVGRSGAGKSTSAHLLLRFWDPQVGAIRLGGRDLREYAVDDLRRQIAIVSQDTYLFNATLLENLRLGRTDATDEEVFEAARRANADEFITRLPDGYDTLVGERGVQLSGGQRQRIAIARALLKNAPVLILDEATSHLDAENERQVRAALAELMHGRTTLVIAHRLSTIQNADRIVVLDSGHVAEQGTHAELLRQDGLYATLVAAQLTRIQSDSAEPARAGQRTF